jgi:hypothetical protein
MVDHSLGVSKHWFEKVSLQRVVGLLEGSKGEITSLTCSVQIVNYKFQPNNALDKEEEPQFECDSQIEVSPWHKISPR